MSNVDLQKFLESRLLALHPEEDVSSGSPAQLKFIQPVLGYLGTDPFETDVEKFISDRFAQEFPDIYESNPGVIRDVFINPLRLLLEPWKRETQLIKKNQSLVDPTVLSDEDADALISNWFMTRSQGSYAKGIARVYYTSPIDQQFEITSRFYSKDDLSFYPTVLTSISAEQMLYNREGSLFYIDVPVQAETEGSAYNLEPGSLVGVDGLSAVRVTNLSVFEGGFEKQDTQSLISAVEVSLNEQSLVTNRGAVARISKTFPGAVKDVRLIGARDPEMQRDILVGTSPGHAWITGQVDLFDGFAYVRARTLDGQEGDVPAPGDTLYVYLANTDVPQASKFMRLEVGRLLVGPSQLNSNIFQLGYFVTWADPEGVLESTFPDAATKASFLSGLPKSFEGGFAKRGQIHISAIPGTEDVDLDVGDGEVHVYGHTDVYVRPAVVSSKTVAISSATDFGSAGATTESPHYALEHVSLVTAAGSNIVSDGSAIDFGEAGVQVGDALVIDTGPDAGIYTVLRVSGSSLYLNQNLKSSSQAPSTLHYRVVRSVRTPLFEPRILHYPFGDLRQNVLNTVIGSSLVYTDDTPPQVDLISFGARAGDTLRILSGLDAGDYTIVSFDPTLGGRGIVLDRPMTSTASSLPIEVFTSMERVERPLIRVKDITLLDSARQSTGLTIPPADPVAVVPVGKMSSAQVLGSSSSASGFVLPDLNGLLTGFSNQASTPPGRYSSGVDAPEGIYISLVMSDGTQTELDLLSDTSGKCSFFLMTPESADNEVNKPPVEPKNGDVLSIKNGPNQGNYLVRNLYKLKYDTGTVPNVFENFVYFVQIYGTFPVDPVRRIADFVKKYLGTNGLEYSSLSFPLQFPSFFTNWFGGLGSSLRQALATAGVVTVPEIDEVQSVIEQLSSCSYECGNPARGALRSYFREPTLFEQWTGDADVVTQYNLATDSGEVIKYRPDPLRYTKLQVIPARTSAEIAPPQYPRDLVVADSGATATFPDFDRLTVFAAGVQAGDVLSVHEEIFAYPSTAVPARHQALVQTFSGSSQVTALPNSGNIFAAAMPGNLLFIDEGQDIGGYRISKVIDGQNVVLDRPLQVSTPVILKSGDSATCTYAAPNDRVLANSGTPFTQADVDEGRFITVYALDFAWMGSYEITGLVNSGQGVTVTLPSGHFPAVADAVPARWAVTASPAASLSTVTRDSAQPTVHGTVPLAGRPIRMYETQPREFPVTDVSPSTSVSSMSVWYDPASSFNLETGLKQPYRILRKNLRRVTTSEMSANQEGALYYFDTEVVSLSPSSLANIPTNSYLTLEEGTYRSVGYRHVVKSQAFTYSTKEDGYLDLPVSILPTGADDFPDSVVRVLGAPIQIAYETSDLISMVQDFVTSEQDRVTASNVLVRHFLPAFVSYDASYLGGSSVSVVAKDIIDYIDSIPSATALDVSELQGLISQRGGDLDTPTKVAVTIHDWSRRMWVEFSENQVGGPLSTDTPVPYAGSPRVTYFIAGQNVSGTEVTQNGERINLSRR